MRRILVYFSVLLLGVIFFLVVAIAFTQTGIFKNWLRDNIVSQANNSLNGELHIQRIRGNLIKSFEISGIAVTSADDTVLHVPYLTVNLLPQRLLKKELIIKVIEIDSLRFFLRQLPDSSWNVAQLLIKESSKETTPKPLEFDWKLLVQDVELRGANVVIQPIIEATPLPRRIENINTNISLAYDDKGLAFNLQNLRLKTRQPQFIINQCTFFISLKNDVLNLQNLAVETSRSRLEGEGVFDLSGGPNHEVHLKALPLAFADIGDFLPNLSVHGSPQLKVNATFKGDSLVFDLDLQEQDQQISMTGMVVSFNTRPVFDIETQLTRLNLGHWLNEPKMHSSITGRLGIEGDGKNLDSLRSTFSAEFRDLIFASRSIDKLNLKANYERSNFDGSLIAQGYFGSIAIKGRIIDTLISPEYDLEGDFTNINLAPISLNDSLQSDLNLAFKIRGIGLQPATMNTNLELSVDPSEIIGVPIDSMFVIAQFYEGNYNIDTLRLISKVGEINVSGEGDIKSNNDLKLSIGFGDLNWLKPHLVADSLNARGYFTADVTGKIDSIRANFKYQIADIVYNTILINTIAGKGDIFYLPDSLRGHADAEIVKSEFSMIEIDTLTIGTEFSQSLFETDVTFSLSDTIHGRIHSIFATDSIPRLTIPNILVNIGQRSWTGGSDSLQVTFGTNYFLIKNARLASNDQFLFIDGVFSLDGEQNLQVQVGNVNLADLSAFWNTPIHIDGSLDLSAYFSGTAASPNISSYFLISDLKLNEYLFKNWKANAVYDNGSLSAEFDLKRNESENIRGTAQIPMRLSFPNSENILAYDKPIHLNIKSESIDLSFLQSFTQQLQNLRGTSFVDVNVTNTLENPQLNGILTVRNGEFEIPQYGANYKDFQLSVKVDTNRVSIDRLRVKGGGGNLTATGYTEYDRKNLKDGVEKVKFDISAQNFLIANSKDLQVRISGNINLEGDLANPRYDGTITIVRSRFYLPAFQNSQDIEMGVKPLLVQVDADSIKNIKKEKQDTPKLIQNLRGNLKIEIPRNTWLRGPDMNIEIAGSVNVVKSGANFEIFGSIRTIRGSYDLYGRRFDLQQGMVTFDGGTEFNPNVEIEARYVFRGVDGEKKTLKLQITDELLNPTIVFSLDDIEIEETDAFSYIVFGRSSDELTHGEKSRMAQQEGTTSSTLVKRMITGQLTGQLANTLRKKLDLDVIEFKGDKNWRQASIVVGKYLTNDLFLSYEREFSIGRNHEVVPEKVSLEYEINKFLFLQATKGDEKTTGFDLIWKVEK